MDDAQTRDGDELLDGDLLDAIALDAGLAEEWDEVEDDSPTDAGDYDFTIDADKESFAKYVTRGRSGCLPHEAYYAPIDAEKVHVRLRHWMTLCPASSRRWLPGHSMEQGENAHSGKLLKRFASSYEALDSSSLNQSLEKGGNLIEKAHSSSDISCQTLRHMTQRF